VIPDEIFISELLNPELLILASFLSLWTYCSHFDVSGVRHPVFSGEGPNMADMKMAQGSRVQGSKIQGSKVQGSKVQGSRFRDLMFINQRFRD
jgi:hypothetical protein